jgi:Ca2+-binding RTX toxin-like protein
MTTISGSGGANSFTVNAGDVLTVDGFGAFGIGAAPINPAELDTLVFLGAEMTARNLILEQTGSDVLIRFDGDAATQITLTNITVEQLENIAGAGNFRFYGESAVTDGVDVWAAAEQAKVVDHANVTTFLNDLDNAVNGRDASADAINGLGGNDVLKGRGGDDLLRGDGGDDRLDGGTGADHMFGGTGNDLYVVDNIGDAVTETEAGPAGGIDIVLSTVSFTLGANVENLTLTGKGAIDGTGNTLDNVIIGNDASNTLDGGAGNDTLRGNAGYDTLLGGQGDDWLYGGAGKDTLDGGTGADTMAGGRGDDVYYVDNSGDKVIETSRFSAGGGRDLVISTVDFTLGENLDNLTLLGSAITGTGNNLANTILGNAEANHLNGRDGNDLLSGAAGADVLDGGAGNDTLDGGSEADLMRGGAGDDHYIVDDAGDQVVEVLAGKGGGVDTVSSSVSFVLGANLEYLELTGSADIDGTGNQLANTITGNAGVNTLKGGDGADTLIGGDGDTLEGDAGNDTLTLEGAGVKAVDGGAGIDTVKLDALDATVDLTASLGAALKSVEVLDLSFNNSGLKQNLILDAKTVFALAGDNGAAFGAHSLIVKGDVGETVTLESGWTVDGTVKDPFGQTGLYNILIKDGATLYVETDLTVKGYGTEIDLGALDGSNGFRIDGAGFNALGTVLANIGDLNGDGYDDLLVGDPIRGSGHGGATIVYGHAGAFSPIVNADAPQPGEGTSINLFGGEGFGRAVSSAGDLNGDGYADFMIGAPSGNSGAVTVLFGHAGSFGNPGMPTVYDALPNSAAGFAITGFGSNDSGGRALASIGDINGDGYDDIIVGAPNTNPNGAAYVIFGHAGGFGTNIDVSALSGANGFRLDGAVGMAGAGYALSGAGDVNGDGYADYLVAGTSATAVVFGHGGTIAPVVNLGALDGSNGFLVDGGSSVAKAGDINGDGFADVIIGGSGVVVFGHAGSFDSHVTAAELDGSNGFRLAETGDTVAAAGDVNGDGYDDFLVGRSFDGSQQQGGLYVVFGHAGGFDPQLDLQKLALDQGFKLTGLHPGDALGQAVSAAGDLNGDGYDDLVVSASGAQPDGQSYVIFGKDFTGAITPGTFGTAAAEAFVGTAGDDVFHGGGGKDSFQGAAGNDQFYVEGPALLELDGGAGNDTAYLSAMGPVVDFTGALRGTISNIETLSLIGGGNNTLKLDTATVAALVGGEITANGVATLKIDGDVGDTIVFDGGWQNLGGDAVTKLTNGSLTVLVSHAKVEGVPPDLGHLDGTNGFTITTSPIIAAAGLGDLNGDGYADVGLGKFKGSDIGAIFYGHADPLKADITPSGADFTTLTFKGGSPNLLGSIAAAGDVNGDGIADMVVGIPQTTDSAVPFLAGSAFIVFGKAGGLGSTMELGALDGNDGFRFEGSTQHLQAGWSVSGAGDVNGDGYADILVGASDLTSSSPGEAYLLFGHAGGFAAELKASDLDGTNGVTLTAGVAGEMAGHSVAAAGDINGDGFADFIVGGRGAAANGKTYAGESFVVFGHGGSFGATLNIDALDGATGFKVAPIAVGTGNGLAYPSPTNVASAGDLNGDGYDDLVIGVYGADPAGKTDAGSAYVVFGHGGAFGATLDLTKLDPSDGFKLEGGSANDAAGFSVAAAGDVNGDGYADLLVSAHQTSYNHPQVGAAYVVFGHAGGFGTTIDLGHLSGDQGITLAAPAASTGFGMTVASAGDVNGDGYADIAISDYHNGKTYIVLGKDFGQDVDHDSPAAGGILTGTAAAENFVGSDQRDVVYLNGGKDTVDAGAGSDVIHALFRSAEGEYFTDLNHNSQYDPGEPFADWNLSGIRDAVVNGPEIFQKVDGGSGQDFLVFDSAGTLDFGNLDNNPATSDRGRITGIEVLDFTNGQQNIIMLHKADVLDMDVHNTDFGGGTLDNVLAVNGETLDTVKLSVADGWGAGDSGAIAGYTVYSAGAVHLAIENGVSVTLS